MQAHSTEEGNRVEPPGPPPDEGMEWIPGGTYTMGSDNRAYPEEGPTVTVTVSGFWMDRFQLTNRKFAEFVQATGHVTFAELPPRAEDYPDAKPELLVPGSAVFIQPTRPVDPRSVCWWDYVPGASWRHPTGPGSSLEGLEDHPVVHVTHADAAAYAAWAGKALPTEAEWERAARGGLDNAIFAWGNELTPQGKLMANYWQGHFPHQSLKPRPGAERVGSYPANGFGLYDMIGNVWEWTDDWYSQRRPSQAKKACCTPKNPRGGTEADSIDLKVPRSEQKPRKVIKGGSFLCAPNYCARYRPAARYPETIDTSTNHVGFRLIVRPM